MSRWGGVLAVLGLVGIAFWGGVMFGSNQNANEAASMGTMKAKVGDQPSTLGKSKSKGSNKSEVKTSTPVSMMEWDSLIRSDPSRAISMFCERADPKSAESIKILESILGSSDLSPEEIWQECSKASNESTRGVCAYHLATKWVQKDSSRFLELAKTMPESIRDVLGSAIAKGLGAQSLEQIVQTAPQFEALLGASGRQSLGSNLVANRLQNSPAEWHDLVFNLLPKLQSQEAKEAVMRTGLASSVNPIQLAEGAFKIGVSNEIFLSLLEKEINKRVSVETEAVGNWINTAPKGIVRDRAAAVYAKAIYLADPAAARAWVNEIQDEVLRTSTASELQ